MKSFSSLDQILGTRGSETPSGRLATPVSAGGDFRPLFAAGSGFGKRLDTFAPPAAGGAEKAQEEGPQIELVQEDGRIQKIIVTCRCCERIELDCTY